MILGIEIENFDVFDKDRAGILLDDYLSDIRKTERLTMLSEALMH